MRRSGCPLPVLVVVVAALGSAQAQAPVGSAAARQIAPPSLDLQTRLISAPAGPAAAGADERAGVSERIRAAVQVVQRMKSDAHVAHLLERAYGVFIVTGYERAAIGLGAQKGKGVLVARRNGEFSNPVFYGMTGLSVGAQAGAAAGAVAFLLMTERAIQRFVSERNFSFNVDVGLTLSSFSGRGHGSAGKLSDVVTWSGTRGAYAGITVGVTEIVVDYAANRVYYGRDRLSVLQMLAGRVQNPHPNVLGMALGV